MQLSLDALDSSGDWIAVPFVFSSGSKIEKKISKKRPSENGREEREYFSWRDVRLLVHIIRLNRHFFVPRPLPRVPTDVRPCALSTLAPMEYREPLPD